MIEGPSQQIDYSYFLIDKCSDLKDIEKGMDLSKFDDEIQKRDLEMEYRVLTRINCHKIQFQNLYKSQHVLFKSRNRYPEILPFLHNIVKLKEIKDPDDRFGTYINASYINVTTIHQTSIIIRLLLITKGESKLSLLLWLQLNLLLKASGK